MKKAALFLVLFLGSASNAFAYDSTGCGLGSLLFKGQKGPVPQILAVTTNGTYTQTFGITSNTSGCDSYGRITGGTGRMFAFLENNLDQFAADAAVGKGETIEAIASITGRDAETVGRVAHNNFAELFGDKDVSAVTVTLKVSPKLSASHRVM